jgi:hypothetical protein
LGIRDKGEGEGNGEHGQIIEQLRRTETSVITTKWGDGGYDGTPGKWVGNDDEKTSVESTRSTEGREMATACFERENRKLETMIMSNRQK